MNTCSDWGIFSGVIEKRCTGGQGVWGERPKIWWVALILWLISCAWTAYYRRRATNCIVIVPNIQSPMTLKLASKRVWSKGTMWTNLVHNTVVPVWDLPRINLPTYLSFYAVVIRRTDKSIIVLKMTHSIIAIFDRSSLRNMLTDSIIVSRNL